MFQCEDYKFSCLANDHDRFDSVCNGELRLPITVDEVMNKSNFCLSLSLDFIKEYENIYLSLNEHLEGLKGRVGLYALWINLGYCQDHKKHKMLCVYIGKGMALSRVQSHIKERWNDSEDLFISFYECENRIAKYLEQLFLDTYNFFLNKNENSGNGYLYCDWDEERFESGTETYNLADIYVAKYPGECE